MIRAAAFWFILLLFAVIVAIQLPLLSLHFALCVAFSLTNTRFYSYGLNGFLAWDQALNAILAPVWRVLFKHPKYDFGYADETISSVIGKNILLAPDHSHYSLFVIDKQLSKLDPYSDSHSVDAIEEDEGEVND